MKSHENFIVRAFARADWGIRTDIDLEPLTVAELMQRLREMYPSLALDHVMVAVNESLVDSGYPVQAADTVALLPPVSGG